MTLRNWRCTRPALLSGQDAAPRAVHSFARTRAQPRSGGSLGLRRSPREAAVAFSPASPLSPYCSVMSQLTAATASGSGPRTPESPWAGGGGQRRASGTEELGVPALSPQEVTEAKSRLRQLAARARASSGGRRAASSLKGASAASPKRGVLSGASALVLRVRGQFLCPAKDERSSSLLSRIKLKHLQRLTCEDGAVVSCRTKAAQSPGRAGASLRRHREKAWGGDPKG